MSLHTYRTRAQAALAEAVQARPQARLGPLLGHRQQPLATPRRCRRRASGRCAPGPRRPRRCPPPSPRSGPGAPGPTRPRAPPPGGRCPRTSGRSSRPRSSSAAWPRSPGTSGRSSSGDSCRRTTAPSRRSPRTAGSPPAASGRPGRPRCPRAARTRTAVPPGGHTPGRGDRNRSRTARLFFRGCDPDDQGRAVVLLLQARLAVDERLELLHAIEDRLDAHPGALPVSMKRGNSILAEGVSQDASPSLKADSVPAHAPTDSAEEPERKGRRHPSCRHPRRGCSPTQGPPRRIARSGRGRHRTCS